MEIISTQRQLKAFCDYDIIEIFSVSFELRLYVILRKYGLTKIIRFKNNVDNTLACCKEYLTQEFGVEYDVASKILDHDLKNVHVRVFEFKDKEIKVYDLKGYLGWHEVFKTSDINDLADYKEDTVAIYNHSSNCYIMMERKHDNVDKQVD